MPMCGGGVDKCAQALRQAGIGHADVDLFELHDAYSIMAALSLESCGFVPAGQALDFARSGGVACDGPLPIATFGGLKARGHPVRAKRTIMLTEQMHFI